MSYEDYSKEELLELVGEIFYDLSGANSFEEMIRYIKQYQKAKERFLFLGYDLICKGDNFSLQNVEGKHD